MKSHTGVPENEQVLEGQFVCFFRDLRNRLLQLVKGLHVDDTSLVWTSTNLYRATSLLEYRSTRES